MPHRVLSFAGKDFLGESLLSPKRSLGTAFFCMGCGDVWGRFILITESGVVEWSIVETVSCEKHYDQWNIAGSMLNGDYRDFLEELPTELLRREFLVLLKHIENYEAFDLRGSIAGGFKPKKGVL